MGHVFDLESPTLMVSTSRAAPIESPLPPVHYSGFRDPESAIRKKYHEQFIRRIRKYGSAIERETPLLPVVVARGVYQEASAWLGELLPREWIVDLTIRPEVIYAHNPQFRKLLRRKSGRDW